MECREWAAALTTARYAYALRTPAAELVHALKYEGWEAAADLMALAMASVELPPLPPGERRVVVPVPTTRARRRRRGYDQAELLAERVARAIRAPLCRAVVRTGERPSQTALTPSERRENVRGVFRPDQSVGDAMKGVQVLLVDDVLTTGATASEVAAVLASMGTRTVSLVAFARALPTPSGGGR